MEIYKDYDRFKTACEEFKSAFTEKYFETGKLFCHPLCDDLIYAPCTPEEAKTNGPEICRMGDMLLMSTDGKNFEPFKLADARKIAEENGSVYITDLLFQSAFEAQCWMIDGRHDTLIISEEHMKKEGKPYAPVTPLTNVVQHFKKINCSFLYTKGTPESPAVLAEKDISEKLDKFLDDLLEEFSRIEFVGEAEFDIFGSRITTDKNEARCMELDKGLSILDTVKTSMQANEAPLKAAGVDFDLLKYSVKLLIKAGEKCGVTISEKDLEGASDAEAVKEKFRNLISEKNGYGFKYTPVDKEKALADIKAAELSAASPEELKKDVADLLKVRPVTGAVFNLARAVSPADAENVENISEYWGCEALSAEELGKYLDKSYIPEDARDENGKLICPGAQAQVISKDIETAAARYKMKNLPVLKELSDRCEEAEKASRTYNGTVFASAEEMEKAVKNEKELAELCADLSVLNEEELKKLRKYIYDMPLDKKTTGRYLLKIKLALNDCEENQLKLLCTGLTLKKRGELEELKKKIADGGFDEVVAAPFKAMINDSILNADLKELTEMFKSIPDSSKADSLEKALASGKYDKIFTRHFTAKIADARDGFARKELADICKDVSSAAKAALDDISKKLDAVKCREALKTTYKKAVSDRYSAIEEQEAAEAFAGIKTADKSKIEELKKIIGSGRFRKDICDKYSADIEKRIEEINNQEFIDKCNSIPKMDRKALEEITAELKNGKHDEDITAKYLGMVDAREKELTKAEIADMCKDLENMDFAKLDELEKKLAEKNYPEDLTKEYTDKIAQRRKALYNKEVDDLCKNIGTMDKPALAELTEKLKNEKYDPEYTKKYFADIETRINKIENDKLTAMCKDVEKLKKEELEKLSAEIGKLDVRKENAAPFLDKIRKAEISLMKKELENLCKNIANTPRKELEKLREALSGGDFDKELSDKYIKQIDERTKELIKKELSELCKNIAGSPKDKLMEMKLTINDTPEYAEQGKAYLEQIDTRLKQIDKAEFDKQMASIDKLSMEELDKFTEDLEKRKPTLDAKLYEASAEKCKARRKLLEETELNKITENLANADLAALNNMREAVAEGDFTPEFTYPYLKKIDDAISDRHIKYFTKLTEKVSGMSKAELVVLLEKIKKNENHCPDDMLQRYVGKVNAEIRKADSNMLSAKCKNIGSFSEHRSYELIKDIQEMDIDDDNKKRYINQITLHIVDMKTRERDAYVEKLNLSMVDNSISGGNNFYVPGISKTFEQQFNACKSYASMEEFELPVLIYLIDVSKADNFYMLTVERFYFKGKNAFGNVAVDQIERFEAKGGVFGAAALHLIEKDGKDSVIPNGLNKKTSENAVKVLNFIVALIQKERAASKIKEAEEIRAAEEAKLKEQEEERRAIEAARKKAEEAEKPAPKPEEKPVLKPEEKTAPKPEDKTPPKPPKPENKPTVPIKPIKPIEVVVSNIPEVKPIQHLEADKKPAPAKPDETPKPAAPVKTETPAKPTEAPKPETAAKPAAPIKTETPAKPAEAPKTETPAKPVEAPKTEAPVKPAETPKPEAPKPELKIRFCDQCGAKIPNEKAKFCMECGNKLSQ